VKLGALNLSINLALSSYCHIFNRGGGGLSPADKVLRVLEDFRSTSKESKSLKDLDTLPDTEDADYTFCASSSLRSLFTISKSSEFDSLGNDVRKHAMGTGTLNEILALEYLFQKGKGSTLKEFQAWKASILCVLSSKSIPPGSWSGHLETYLLLRPHLGRYLGAASVRENIKDEAPRGLRDFALSNAFCHTLFSSKWADTESESLFLDFYNDVFLCIASKQESKPIVGIDPHLVGATSPTLAQLLLRGRRILKAINFFDNIEPFESLCSDVLAQVSLSEYSGSDSTSIAARQMRIQGMQAAGTQMHLFLSTPPTMKMALPFTPSSTSLDMKELEEDADDVRNRRRQDRRFSTQKNETVPNTGAVTPYNKRLKSVPSVGSSTQNTALPSSSGSPSVSFPSSGAAPSMASGSLKSIGSQVIEGSKVHDILLKGGNQLETPWGILNLRAAVTELKDPKLVTEKDWGYLVAMKKGGLSGFDALAYSRLPGRALGLPARKIPADSWEVVLKHFR
jgi:hypothetical protein